MQSSRAPGDMYYLVLIVCVAVVIQQSKAVPSPIVIIPGILGSQVKVLDSSEDKCGTNGKYKQMWVSKKRMCSVFFGDKYPTCLEKGLRLIYNSEDDTFYDNIHTKVLVPSMGDSDPKMVEFLDGESKDLNSRLAKYFYKMVKSLVDKYGYERKFSIRAAPYDWRLAGDELEKRGYYLKLKSMIKRMYKQNGDTKVTLVAHSMGGPVSLYFLTAYKGINQAWKDKYIHAYITLGAAWAGGVAAIQPMISGYQLVPKWLGGVIDLRFIPRLARSLESIPWLFPTPSVFKDKILVSTPNNNYTANNYSELFGEQHLNISNVYFNYERVQKLLPDYPAPNVSTYCYYGVGLPTITRIKYEKDFNGSGVLKHESAKPETDMNGDGTVNNESSEVCHRWSAMAPKYHFEYERLNKVEHKEIVENKNVIKKIAAIAAKPKISYKKSKKTWCCG